MWYNIHARTLPEISCSHLVLDYLGFCCFEERILASKLNELQSAIAAVAKETKTGLFLTNIIFLTVRNFLP